MKARSKALWVCGIASALTVALYAFADMGLYPSRALPLLWCFFSWNFFAYGLGRDMWPWILVELKGGRQGKSGVREVHFWMTVATYLGLLATIAFSG